MLGSREKQWAWSPVEEDAKADGDQHQVPAVRLWHIPKWGREIFTLSGNALVGIPFMHLVSESPGPDPARGGTAAQAPGGRAGPASALSAPTPNPHARVKRKISGPGFPEEEADETQVEVKQEEEDETCASSSSSRKRRCREGVPAHKLGSSALWKERSSLCREAF